MADLKVKFLGVEFKNPLVAASAEPTANYENMERVIEAGAVSCVSFYGGELRAGSLTRYLSGYDLVRVKARGAGDPATVTLADPVAEEVFSGFSLRVSAGRWPAPLERSGNCVIAPGRPGAVRLVCTSETGPAEIRSLDGPHGKVQVPAVDAARVEAPLGRGPHGACLLGGSTGAAEKAGHKRVVLVELESEK